MDRSRLRRMACAVVVAACVGLSVSGAPLYGAPSAAGDPFGALGVTRMSAGVPAVAFDLKALDGATLGSQHLAGKVVVLNFWATWCGPCKEEMPSLARLQSQFDPGQVRVVTVTADIHPKGIKQFLDHLGIKLPVLFDEDQELSRLFTVRGLPTTVLIDQDGQALGRAVGPRAWDSQESIALLRHVLDRQP
jgi:thiol-disulfide isomerase/thioredoxin